MKAGVRKFGAAERGLLPEGRMAGPMPWVIAIMMFLTVLAAAAGLGLAGAASRLDDQIGSRITIQVVEANPELRQRRRRGPPSPRFAPLPGVIDGPAGAARRRSRPCSSPGSAPAASRATCRCRP